MNSTIMHAKTIKLHKKDLCPVARIENLLSMDYRKYFATIANHDKSMPTRHCWEPGDAHCPHSILVGRSHTDAPFGRKMALTIELFLCDPDGYFSLNRTGLLRFPRRIVRMVNLSTFRRFIHVIACITPISASGGQSDDEGDEQNTPE